MGDVWVRFCTQRTQLMRNSGRDMHDRGDMALTDLSMLAPGPCSSKTISTNGGILLSSWLLFWFGKTHLSLTYLTKKKKKNLQIMTRKIWWYLRCSELFVCKKCFQANSFFTQPSQCSKVDTVCYSVFTNGSYWGQGVCGIRTSQ